MAESGGRQDNVSRLDRIGADLELVVGEPESFRAGHKMLLRSPVLLRDSLGSLK